MAVLDSYLHFPNGACAEAMRFYERVLGGKLEMMLNYGDSPEPQHCPEGAEKLVMHASLLIDGRRLMASDTPPTFERKPMAGFSLSLTYPNADEARRIFDALANGGSVIMPMQQTFWADAFGMLRDQYGTPWMVGGGPKQVA